MKEKLDVVRGSGNVFRDLGHKNADAARFKAILAAEISKTRNKERLTVRATHDLTGLAATGFSPIRNARLGQFTVDRLMSILNRLGSRVEVKIRVRRLVSAEDRVPAWQRRGTTRNNRAHLKRPNSAAGFRRIGHSPV